MKTTKGGKSASLHVRVTPELKARVLASARQNQVNESTIVEWALDQLLKFAAQQGGRLVRLPLDTNGKAQ